MSTGLVYAPIYLEHDTGSHVENAGRLKAVMFLLQESGVASLLAAVAPVAATPEQIATVHDAGYIAEVRRRAESGGGWLDADTVVSSRSYEVATYAAGGVLAAVDAVFKGEVTNAFALVRPPGHHATPSRAMGFCLFNNVAIAARHAMAAWGASRIAIVDFDVHHGNGTQDIFYAEPAVLYFSTHQMPLYPGTGHTDETGAGTAAGTKVNVPLPPGCGDEEFLTVYRDIMVPVVERFRPDLIMVSAGYDAHWADTLASMQVTVSGFAEIARILKESAERLCSGRLIFSLEGGYDYAALSHSVKATLDVLRGSNEVADTLGFRPKQMRPRGMPGYIQELKRTHKV